MRAKVIQVIETYTQLGEGTKEDPVRLVTEYYTLDGTLLWQDAGLVSEQPTKRQDPE